MAGVADMNVKIGADISGLVNDVNAAADVINKLKTANVRLATETKQLTAELNKNQKQINSLTDAQDKALNKSSDYYQQLIAQITALKSRNDQLYISIADNKNVLSKSESVIKSYTQSISFSEKEHNKLSESFRRLTNINDIASRGIERFERLLTTAVEGGVAGLVIAISGPLIDAFENWYDTINKVSDAQQLLKDNIKNTSDINKAAGEDIVKQTASLSTLYSIATDVSRSMYARVAATKELQKEFPSYFKNISQENILNGNAKSAYDALTDSLIANALAKAQLDKITNIGVKKSDLQSQVDDLIAERKRQLDAIKGTKIANPLSTLDNAGGVTVSAVQQKNEINNYFDQQLKPLQSKIKSFDSQINAIKSKLNPAALLAGDSKDSKAEPAATGILAVFDAQIKVLEDYKKNIATTAGEIASANAQIKALQEEKVKYDPTYRIKKDPETISDVLEKLKAKLDAIKGDSITLDTKQAQASISAINTAIDTLFTKFKLNNKSPQIIALRAQVNDLELQIDSKKAKDLIDKAVLKDRTKPIELPPFVAHAEAVIKLESKIQQGTGDITEALRQQILDELKKRGIIRTAPMKIGVDVAGNPIMTKSQPITGSTSYAELLATLQGNNKELQKMAQLTTDVLSPAFDALFTGILTGSQNAFKGFGDALEKTIVQLGVAVLKAAAFAAIFSALGMGSFSSAFTKLLGFSKGGSVKGFATGGPVWGGGTSTSDSIPARLSRGEYVIKAAKVSEFGLDFFNKINFGNYNIADIMKDKFGMMRFASGGFVSPNYINTQPRMLIPAMSIGGGQLIEIQGNFELRNDRLVAAVSRGNAKVGRNS